jgi:SAM-dependent methyltransferase
MKLSELVNYYNQLCAVTARQPQQVAMTEMDRITNLASDDDLNRLSAEIRASFDRFEDELDRLRALVKDQISQQELPYLQESYRVYEEIKAAKYGWYDRKFPDYVPPNLREELALTYKNIKTFNETALMNRLHISDEAAEYIQNRILLHSSWQKTTMILRPGLEKWVGYLVSNDPLYLVDENHELLEPAIQQFSQQYKQRLRLYTIRESLEDEMFKSLPDDQFGMVLAYNYFNHKPFEHIQRYLSEIYNKLRPGGSLLMTYNDCDRWKGVLAAETQSALYTPGSLILNYAKYLKYEITASWHENGPWTWLELKKPGEFQSLRGGQTLAKVIPK